MQCKNSIHTLFAGNSPMFHKWLQQHDKHLFIIKENTKSLTIKHTGSSMRSVLCIVIGEGQIMLFLLKVKAAEAL